MHLVAERLKVLAQAAGWWHMAMEGLMVYGIVPSTVMVGYRLAP